MYIVSYTYIYIYIYRCAIGPEFINTVNDIFGYAAGANAIFGYVTGAIAKCAVE